MLTNSTPETSPSFADVDMGASAAGYTVHKIFRSAGEMIADGEGAFRASYIGERSDEHTRLTPGRRIYIAYKRDVYIAYKRDLSLRDILVHSTDSSSTEQAGSHACQRPRCQTLKWNR